MIEENSVQKNTGNGSSSYKLSELLLSFFLVVSAGLTFTIPSYNGAYIDGNEKSLVKMRGAPRQNIQMGVPEVWLDKFSNTLNNHGIKVLVSKLGGAWIIDVKNHQSLSPSDEKQLKIFLEHYGVDSKDISELHIRLTGFS